MQQNHCIRSPAHHTVQLSSMQPQYDINWNSKRDGLVLLLVGLLMARVSSSETSSELSVPSFWSTLLPTVPFPHSLRPRLSSLNEDQVRAFSSMMTDGSLSNHSAEFCAVAKLFCSGKTKLVQPLVGSVIGSGSDDNMFIANRDLHAGALLTLPSARSVVPASPFLPRALADRLPFSSGRLPELLQTLHIPSRSNLSRNIATTIESCESPNFEGQKMECVTSLEAMVAFVVSKLGSEVQMISEPSFEGAAEEVRVLGVVGRSASHAAAPPVACHGLPYPWGVFYCHELKASKLYHVTMRVSEGNAILSHSMLCHEWMPTLANFEEFKRLHITKGESLCHWFFGNELVWTAI